MYFMNFVKKNFWGVLKLAGAGGPKTGSFLQKKHFLDILIFGLTIELKTAFCNTCILYIYKTMECASDDKH